MHKLKWNFYSERRDKGVSYASSDKGGYYIDCWPNWFEVRVNGESMDKVSTLEEAIRLAECDYCERKGDDE